MKLNLVMDLLVDTKDLKMYVNIGPDWSEPELIVHREGLENYLSNDINQKE